MASKRYFNTRQVMAGFGVSDTTVYLWRQGTSTREALPCEVEGRNVYFAEGAMKTWAKKHGLTFSVEKAEKGKPRAKTGPKPGGAKRGVPRKASARKSKH